MSQELVAWVGFIIFVVVVLAVDLGVLNRKAHVVSIREALTFTAGLAVLALGFNALVYVMYENHWLGLGNHVDKLDGMRNDGRLAAVKFFTGYIIEISLSADNVFVMAMIFQYLRVPPQYQHRVLFWGILGALIMRGTMILLGATLIARYHWILYLFGAFLVFTAIRMLVQKDTGEDVGDSAVIRWVRRFFPVTPTYHGQQFAILQDGRRVLTPLAVALVLVETTDLVFAVDSIPAIFAITTDPFIVFTSNVFAILGLRSLYFALAGAMEKFRYLKVSLAAILGLVGVKMLVADLLKEYIGPSFNFYLLGMVALILVIGALASVVAARREAGNDRGVLTD
ncbi:MAG: TerC family protein [Cytophagaceae bacterium]|nr:TerC family protein [Gemmatimonadaceae bacterium]